MFLLHQLAKNACSGYCKTHFWVCTATNLGRLFQIEIVILTEISCFFIKHVSCNVQAWSYCQKCFNPQGAAGLVTRLIEFDLADVHCEIAARAEEMLNTLLGELKQGGGSEATLRASSPSAFTLYVWVSVFETAAELTGN